MAQPMRPHFEDQFKQIWVIDFEFSAPDGSRPSVICLVAKDIVSEKTIRLWQDELQKLKEPPFDIGPDSLFASPCPKFSVPEVANVS